MLACPPILHYLDYIITWIKRSFRKVVMGLQGKWFKYEKKIYKAQSNFLKTSGAQNFSFLITSIPLNLHNKAPIALLLSFLFLFFSLLLLFKTILLYFFNFFFHIWSFWTIHFSFSQISNHVYSFRHTPTLISFIPSQKSQQIL